MDTPKHNTIQHKTHVNITPLAVVVVTVVVLAAVVVATVVLAVVVVLATVTVVVLVVVVVLFYAVSRVPSRLCVSTHSVPYILCLCTHQSSESMVYTSICPLRSRSCIYRLYTGNHSQVYTYPTIPHHIHTVRIYPHGGIHIPRIYPYDPLSHMDPNRSRVPTRHPFPVYVYIHPLDVHYGR